ncbi:hypothetical protein [Parapedobacter indicus]|uniref:Uncharacterized protein n=1 Tax=Parapedobacter indicus TaxID=1477437 RepID=A0A1I3U9J8_9SPHI|nr:hypothetical protein [Parapedobacter indicus]PPK99200.1 hypothetical protein CLV26_11450 [Parapedobacter indicus]SFJ79393.1 hypothetical protein SAMN05444682_11450 [Parapedobacter indicus]
MTAIKQLSFTAVTLLFSIVAVAQESRAQRFERIEAEKIAFITKELNLTPSEAQKFFPVYNQYFREISTLKRERRSNHNQSKSAPNLQSQKLPGTSFNPTGRDVLAFDAKELEVKKIYRKRFSELIGPARASRFFEVEVEFRNYLLRELQHRRRDRGDE